MFTHFSEAARRFSERIMKEKQKEKDKKKTVPAVKKEKRKRATVS